MLPTTASRRRGFSLIELLVVIAIIAILCALLMAAVMRMLTVPPQKNTEALILKLANSLAQQWAAVVQEARDEDPNQVMGNPNFWTGFLAANGNDQETARAAWVKLRLQQEFPDSIATAQTPPGGLPPKAYYTQTLGGVVLSDPKTQSGVCLFAALTVGRRGMEFDPGTLAPKEAKAVYAEVKGLFDGWERPIQFSNRGGTKFRIWSFGANGKDGDADDVDSDILRLGK